MDFPSTEAFHSNSSDEGDVKNVQNNILVYEKQLKEKKRSLSLVKPSQKGVVLEVIWNDLMRLESQLKKEQSYLLGYVSDQNEVIENQRLEIERLRRDNRRLLKKLSKLSDINVDKNDIYQSDDNLINANDHDSLSEVKDCTEECNSNFHGQCISPNSYASKLNKNSRIKHKPPIPEKPKFVSTKIIKSAVQKKDKKCNIVSTIGLLLGDESDPGVVGGSEPSSPDSSFKSTAPRVLRLAKQFDEVSLNQPGQDHKSTKFQVEDQEVTSGYNSDSISDLDHEYENIFYGNGTRPEPARRNRDRLIHHRNGTSNLSTNSNIDYQSNIDDRNGRLRTGVTPSNQNTTESGSVGTTADPPGLMDNFEEFKFESFDLEDSDQLSSSDPPMPLRVGGDGAEDKKRATILDPSPVKGYSSVEVIAYEKFLEMTGLSQKSILTPRMFSNHRSMLKPRDIKHRDKLRSAFAFSAADDSVSASLKSVPAASRGPFSASNHNQTISSQAQKKENPYL